MTTQSEALRHAMAAATTGQEQNALAAQLAAADRAAAVRKQAERDLDWAAMAADATLTPVAVHTVHTAATDWLGEIPEGVPDGPRRIIAEASLWYMRIPEFVREDTDEFFAQARGAALRTAGRLGLQRAAVEDQFLDYVHFLRKRAGSGLPQIQQITDANNAPAPTPLPPQVFDNFAPPVDPVNAPVSGTESSDRAPIMQELRSTGPAAGPGTAPTAAPQPAGAPAPDPSAGHVADDLEQDDDDDDDTEDAKQDKGALTGATARRHPILVTAAMPHHSLDDDDYDFFSDAYDPDEARDRHHDEMRRRAEVPAPDHREMERRKDFGHAYQWQRYQDALDEYGDPEIARQMHPLPGTRAHVGASTLDQIQQTTAPDGVTDRPTPLPETVAYPWIISPNAENQAPPTDGEMAQTPSGGTTGEAAYGRQAAHTHTADQWHGQEWPHAAVQPDAANTPATTPTPPTGSAAAGAADARADAAATDTAPTYSDASGGAPEYARAYAENYLVDPPLRTSVPPGMSGPPTHPARMSHLLTTAAERELPDYAAGYRSGLTWKAGGAVPRFGNDTYEAGLYAGLLDNPGAQAAFTERHRLAATEGNNPAAGARIARHARASAFFLGSPALPDGVMESGPYLRATAGVSTDLDTMAPGTSADPTGNTPFNGPGRPPILEGQYGAADPGGPAPYNGAPPYGTPAVPLGEGDTTGTPVTVPDTGMTTPNRATAAAAFRRTVQANLARTAAGAPLLTYPEKGSL